MIEYRGFIIEHERYLGEDIYYIYEPKNWFLLESRNKLSSAKKYIDEQLKE